jgi:hypothetical protein
VAAKHGRLRRGYCIRLRNDTPHFGASRTWHLASWLCIDGLGTGARKRKGEEEASIATTARRMLELRTHEERTHVPYVTALEGIPAFCLCRNLRIKRCINTTQAHHLPRQTTACLLYCKCLSIPQPHPSQSDLYGTRLYMLVASNASFI